jgi:hypothetical protein
VVITTAADVTLRTYDNLAKAPTASSATGFAPLLLTWTQVTSSASPLALTINDAGKAYEADTTGGNIEFDLPSAASVGNGKGFAFKKTAAANSLIIDPSGTETIDGVSTSLTLTTKDSIVYIISNGANWYRLQAPIAGLRSMQAFTASSTWTRPEGISRIIVISTGGGGGGGGADSLDGTSNGAAAGGGAGATCIKLFDAATVGASQTVTIGAGGTAGANTGGNGGAGGNTTFGALHTAGGGAGGLGSATGAAEDMQPGTAGGTATGGLINITGGEGGFGRGDGNYIASGYGGASFWGGGAVGVVQSGSGATAGRNGQAFGAGASGASNANTTAGAAGGVGAGGICVVLEYGE